MHTLSREVNDIYAGLLIEELRQYRKEHPDIQLVTGLRDTLPGVPATKVETVYEGYRAYQRTPWGLTAPASVSYYTHGELARKNPLRIAKSEPDSLPYPGYADPELGTAVVDPTTGITRVYTGLFTMVDTPNGLEARDELEDVAHALETGTPAWTGIVRLPNGRLDAWKLLREIRSQAAQECPGLWVASLYIDNNRANPWGTDVAHIANDEVSVGLVGFAYNADHELIYLHIVGHKTATRSIWGSLSTAHKRTLSITSPHGKHTVTSTHNYETYTTPLDDGGRTGLIRMLMVDRRALQPETAHGAYLIVPQGLEGAPFYRAFAARLTATLPVPILPEWGETLYTAGQANGLLIPCVCGGDVGEALALQSDAAWLELLEGYLQADYLTV